MRARAVSPNAVYISWRAAHDNVRVSGYLVWRGSRRVATLGRSARHVTTRGLLPGHRYTFSIRARDAAGNRSRAVKVSLTTPRATSRGSVTVQLPASPTAPLVNTQLTTQDVWPGVFSSLPSADGVTPQARLNQLAPPNMRFHVGTDGGYGGNNTAVALPFPPAGLPYTDSVSGMTMTTAWDFSHLNSLLGEASAFGGPAAAAPLLLNVRYLPDTMYTGAHSFGSEGTFSDQTYTAAATYFANLIKYYNTNPVSAPVPGATPWPKPAGPWPIRYVEIYNEPDYAWENPRVPPTLSAPTLTAAKVAGGSLPAGTYSYRATALNATGSPGNGETAAGPAVTATISAADVAAGTRSVQLGWSATSNLGIDPSAYTIYGRSAGNQQVMSVVGADAAGGLSFTDGGSIAPGLQAAPTADSGSGGGPPLSPLQYRDFWDKVAPAIKAVDPTVQLVGPAPTSPQPINGPSVIRTAGPTAGPDDTSYQDPRNYFQVIEGAGEPNPPDVVSYHGYGGWQGTESNAELLGTIDTLTSGLTTNVLPYTGSTPLWQTEANVQAGDLPAGDGRGTNQFAVAWWGKLFAQMAQVSPHLERLHQYMITESPTFDLFWDATHPDLPDSLAGRATLPYWEMRQLNSLFVPGSRRLVVSGLPAGVQALAVASPPGFTHVSVLLVNDAATEQDVSATVGLAGATATAARVRTIQASTNRASGPATTTVAAGAPAPVHLSGYGIALVDFDT